MNVLREVAMTTRAKLILLAVVVAAIATAGGFIYTGAGASDVGMQAPAANTVDCSHRPRISMRVEYNEASKTRTGIARVNEDCSVEQRIVDLSQAEYQTLKASGDLPADAFSRPDVSGQPLPSVSATGDLLYDGSGGKSVAGTNLACHEVPFLGCVDEVSVSASLFFTYDDDEVTGYHSARASDWDGKCWVTTSSASGRWFTGGLPTAISYPTSASWDVDDNSICAGLDYGGSLTVEPIGIGDGNTAIQCSEDFTGPYPTRYICSPD